MGLCPPFKGPEGMGVVYKLIPKKNKSTRITVLSYKK